MLTIVTGRDLVPDCRGGAGRAAHQGFHFRHETDPERERCPLTLPHREATISGLGWRGKEGVHRILMSYYRKWATPLSRCTREPVPALSHATARGWSAVA